MSAKIKKRPDIKDPYEREVAELGGTLIQAAIPKIPDGKNGGCGSPTHVHGTNGGQMACGDVLRQLDGSITPYYCGYCDQQRKGKHA